jgi:hypothetical protein
VALFSETHLKPHELFFISNYHFYRNDHNPGRKGRIAIAVITGIPHNHVDLPPLVSAEAAGVSIPIVNSEVLLAAVHNLWTMPGVMLTSLSSYASDINLFWWVI